MFFNRPVPGYADYRTPIKGLYLCGSSSHPGGGVMAAPGANAAREVLRDLGPKAAGGKPPEAAACRDRKGVVEGKNVSVRVDHGGRRILKTKKKSNLRQAKQTRTDTH